MDSHLASFRNSNLKQLGNWPIILSSRSFVTPPFSLALTRPLNARTATSIIAVQEKSQKNQSEPEKNKRGKTRVCRSVPIRESFRGWSSYRERKKLTLNKTLSVRSHSQT